MKTLIRSKSVFVNSFRVAVLFGWRCCWIEFHISSICFSSWHSSLSYWSFTIPQSVHHSFCTQSSLHHFHTQKPTVPWGFLNMTRLSFTESRRHAGWRGLGRRRSPGGPLVLLTTCSDSQPLSLTRCDLSDRWSILQAAVEASTRVFGELVMWRGMLCHPESTKR